MTAVWITAIIAALLATTTTVAAIKDIAKAKHQAATCKHCTHDKDKENEA